MSLSKKGVLIVKERYQKRVSNHCHLMAIIVAKIDYKSDAYFAETLAAQGFERKSLPANPIAFIGHGL